MLLVVLHMVTPQITRGSFDRPNLYLEVRRKKETFWDSIQPLVKGVGFPGSTIIYCLRKREVEMVAEELEEQGLKVAIRPVHKNLFLEFPKYPGSFMLHFDR